MMIILKQLVLLLSVYFTSLVKHCLEWVKWAFAAFRTVRMNPDISRAELVDQGGSQPWQTNVALRTYSCGNTMVAVQTSTHIFHVDLERLSYSSEYFRALSRSGMRETAELLIDLEHVPSKIFHNLLEFTFLQRFSVPEEELGEHIATGSYLLASLFLAECLTSLDHALNPENCRAYLDLSREICCQEMRETVYGYLSKHLLELSHLTRSLGAAEEEVLIQLRSQGPRRLWALRKESLTSRNQRETAAARCLYSLAGSEDDGDWFQEAQLPFTAEKWCFTTAVLYNYLYLIGGYRHKAKRGYQFKMASFRYNPFTHSWTSTASLIKHRRHFSTAVCEGSIFAVGGWYLDSLVAPDSCTALYTAVERYDPWADSWTFVAPLPLTDFHFSMSLSHDIPLTATLGPCIYVIGTIQRTGEKLILQYNTRQDVWTELLPTLTRANAEIPSLYFLGSTDRLHVIGGNNSGNVVTSFCVESLRWGRVRTTKKMALVGQGTVLDGKMYMPAIDCNAVVRLDLHSLSAHTLPPLPIPTSYEALFHLHI